MITESELFKVVSLMSICCKFSSLSHLLATFQVSAAGHGDVVIHVYSRNDRNCGVLLVDHMGD